MKNQPSIRWSLTLASFLLALSSFVCVAGDDNNTPPPNTGGGTTTTTTNLVTNGNGQVTTNPDGSKTYTGNWTTTNENTGKTWDTTNTTNVEKTSNGKAWQRDSTTTNSNGGSSERQTTGSSVNNGNGSGTWQSTTTGEATNAKGKESDWTTQRNGSWEKNADGSVGFQKTADTTFKDGATVDRQTTGTITKTSNGYDKDSTTTGEATGPKGKQTDWTTNRTEEVTNNGNGTKSINEQVTRTNSNGKTTTIDKTGELVKEGNGKWEYEGGASVTKSSPSNGTSAGSNAADTRGLNNGSSEKPQAEGPGHQEFRNRVGAFRKQWENLRNNGGTPAEHAALRSQFEGLKKHWEGLKANASAETSKHWENLRKDWEENEERERGGRNRR